MMADYPHDSGRSPKIKRGGHLIIAVPNNSMQRLTFKPSYWLASREKKLRAIIEPIPYEKTFSEVHLIHFTPQSLLNILNKHGFSIKEISIDNISLNPRALKDIKYSVRNFAAKMFKYYGHKVLFVCATKD